PGLLENERAAVALDTEHDIGDAAAQWLDPRRPGADPTALAQVIQGIGRRDLEHNGHNTRGSTRIAKEIPCGGSPLAHIPNSLGRVIRYHDRSPLSPEDSACLTTQNSTPHSMPLDRRD